jgi:hypothetical protein
MGYRRSDAAWTRDQAAAPLSSAASEMAWTPFQSGTVNPVRGCTCPPCPPEAACCCSRASETCRRVSSCSAREVRGQYTRNPCPQTLQRTSLTVLEILHRTCIAVSDLSKRSRLRSEPGSRQPAYRIGLQQAPAIVLEQNPLVPSCYYLWPIDRAQAVRATETCHRRSLLPPAFYTGSRDDCLDHEHIRTC